MSDTKDMILARFNELEPNPLNDLYFCSMYDINNLYLGVLFILKQGNRFVINTPIDDPKIIKYVRIHICHHRRSTTCGFKFNYNYHIKNIDNIEYKYEIVL